MLLSKEVFPALTPVYIYTCYILVEIGRRMSGGMERHFITMCNIYMLSLRCLSCIYTSGAAQLSLGLSRSSDNFTIFREVYKLFGNWHMDVFYVQHDFTILTYLFAAYLTWLNFILLYYIILYYIFIVLDDYNNDT